MDGQPRLAIACDRQFLIQSVSSSGGGGYVFASEFDMKNGSSSKKMGGWWYEVSMNYANRSVLFVRDVRILCGFSRPPKSTSSAAGRMNDEWRRDWASLSADVVGFRSQHSF